MVPPKNIYYIVLPTISRRRKAKLCCKMNSIFCTDEMERIIIMDPRVVFHIDETQKWNLIINSVHNLLLSYEGIFPNAIVEVLANSEAVKGYLLDGGIADSHIIEALSQKGVRFVACNHALQGMKITKEQICQFVKIVPAGVRELVDRQMEGYAYIKP